MNAQIDLIIVTDRIAAQHRQSAAERLAGQSRRDGTAPGKREFRFRRPVQDVAFR
jgi:hypothetical protein